LGSLLFGYSLAAMGSLGFSVVFAVLLSIFAFEEADF